MCVCEGGWTGEDCSVEECRINCGDHGSCENMECVCHQGEFHDFTEADPVLCNYKEIPIYVRNFKEIRLYGIIRIVILL